MRFQVPVKDESRISSLDSLSTPGNAVSGTVKLGLNSVFMDNRLVLLGMSIFIVQNVASIEVRANSTIRSRAILKKCWPTREASGVEVGITKMMNNATSVLYLASKTPLTG